MSENIKTINAGIKQITNGINESIKQTEEYIKKSTYNKKEYDPIIEIYNKTLKSIEDFNINSIDGQLLKKSLSDSFGKLKDSQIEWQNEILRASCLEDESLEEDADDDIDMQIKNAYHNVDLESEDIKTFTNFAIKDLNKLTKKVNEINEKYQNKRKKSNKI